LVKTKDEGFRLSLVGKKLSTPLDLLENKVGSTFSESSISTDSEALRLTEGEGVMMAASHLVYS
jgi:hypothetical protein